MAVIGRHSMILTQEHEVYSEPSFQNISFFLVKDEYYPRSGGDNLSQILI